MGQLQKLVKYRRQKSVKCLQGEIGAVNVNSLASLFQKSEVYSLLTCSFMYQPIPRVTTSPSLGDPGAFDQNICLGAGI